MTDYPLLLKEYGLKATFQRMQILENIEKYGHLSVDDIYAKVSKTYPSISLATVYKNIILMVENSVLVEVPISGKKLKYELNKEEHIHLVCTICGEVEDRPLIEETHRLLNKLSQNENFHLTKQQINLYGICSSCQQH